jgi:hypothetical protein
VREIDKDLTRVPDDELTQRLRDLGDDTAA